MELPTMLQMRKLNQYLIYLKNFSKIKREKVFYTKKGNLIFLKVPDIIFDEEYLSAANKWHLHGYEVNSPLQQYRLFPERMYKEVIFNKPYLFIQILEKEFEEIKAKHEIICDDSTK